MLKFGRAVTKKRTLILIVSLLLLIPSVIGYINTRVNFDVLVYLPDTMETVKGQDILLDEFNKGGFAMVMFDGMENKDVAQVKKKIEKVNHVDSVVWYDSVMDVSIIAKKVLHRHPFEVGGQMPSRRTEALHAARHLLRCGMTVHNRVPGIEKSIRRDIIRLVIRIIVEASGCRCLRAQSQCPPVGIVRCAEVLRHPALFANLHRGINVPVIVRQRAAGLLRPQPR